MLLFFHHNFMWLSSVTAITHTLFSLSKFEVEWISIPRSSIRWKASAKYRDIVDRRRIWTTDRKNPRFARCKTKLIFLCNEVCEDMFQERWLKRWQLRYVLTRPHEFVLKSNHLALGSSLISCTMKVEQSTVRPNLTFLCSKEILGTRSVISKAFAVSLSLSFHLSRPPRAIYMQREYPKMGNLWMWEILEGMQPYPPWMIHALAEWAAFVS